MGKGTLRRVDEVFDCWFESGSMPYAQLHYPFENADRFENGFPADFIAEGLDQTRGWFYTLMVISTCLFDRPAFKNLIVNGLVLAADGKKMSKRLKNYPDVTVVVDKYGADALRLYLISSPVVRAEPVRFQEEGVNEVVRGVLLPWFNAFRFFIQSVERWEQQAGTNFVPSVEAAMSSKNDVDIWVLAAAQGLVAFVHQEMQAYRLYTVVPRLVEFIEELTNWYVRLNRDRLKGTNGEPEALVGLHVLFDVLLTMTIIMAPFTPYFSEYLYQQLRKLCPLYGNTDPAVPEDALGKSNSVHFLMLPAVDQSRINARAVSRFKTLQQAVVLARVARERKRIRTNLPLKSVLVVSANNDHIDALTYLQPYFLSEINAWDVQLSNDWESYCTLSVMPNWKDLGKRLGKQMKAVAKGIQDLSQAELIAFMKSGLITVCGFDLTLEDLVVKRVFNGDTSRYEAAVSDDGTLLIAIDTTCDDSVYQELRARWLTAAVQKTRKSVGLVLGDKVEAFYSSDSPEVMKQLGEALQKHAATTVRRIKSVPLPLSCKPKHALVLGSEVFNDTDAAASPVTLWLTVPAWSVDTEAVTATLPAAATTSADSTSSAVAAVEMFVQTSRYERFVESSTLVLGVGESAASLTLQTNVHIFPSALDMVVAKGPTAAFPFPPSAADVTLAAV